MYRQQVRHPAHLRARFLQVAVQAVKGGRDQMGPEECALVELMCHPEEANRPTVVEVLRDQWWTCNPQ